jgi:hypothetical protein
MDAVREMLDPDVILRDRPEPGPYVGREAVTRFMEQLRKGECDSRADLRAPRALYEPL